MSVFTTKERKNWKIQFNSTDTNKIRFEKIQRRLSELSSESIFDIYGLLEKDLDTHLTKAEKELDSLEKATNPTQEIETTKAESVNLKE